MPGRPAHVTGRPTVVVGFDDRRRLVSLPKVGQARGARFVVESPGTYHYWATTTGMPLTFRGGPDSQLSGALVVDPPHGVVEADRVLVITEWASLTRVQLADLAAHPDPSARFLELRPLVVFTVNGLAWPH